MTENEAIEQRTLDRTKQRGKLMGLIGRGINLCLVLLPLLNFYVVVCRNWL